MYSDPGFTRGVHRLLLALVLAWTVAAVHATPAAGPCEQPLPADTGPAAAAIVRTACLEHKVWFEPFIDANGRLASLTVTEAERTRLRDDTPAWQRVARYWRESGTLSSMIHIAGARSCLYPGSGREADSDCRAYLVDNPWSAAFVSWVMARTSLPGFVGSPRHVDYIARAWHNPEDSPYVHADPFVARAAPGDLLCHLRDDDQTLGPKGLQQALDERKRQMPQRSHCDIVIAAGLDGDHTLYLIGGNVFDAVTMRKMPLDAEGRLLASEVALPVRVAPMADASIDTSAPASGDCQPGNPASCSFNRRDWVVLLRLKPQLQPQPATLMAIPTPVD